MYIHLGESISINDTTVIGVFDLENTTIGQDTRMYLNRMKKEGRAVEVSAEMPKSFVVCMENGGGAIFDMLPQASDEPYFERLFLTPQHVNFGPLCQGFDVPYACAETADELNAAVNAALGVPGISFVSAKLPLRGVRERYGKYW